MPSSCSGLTACSRSIRSRNLDRCGHRPARLRRFAHARVSFMESTAKPRFTRSAKRQGLLVCARCRSHVAVIQPITGFPEGVRWAKSVVGSTSLWIDTWRGYPQSCSALVGFGAALNFHVTDTSNPHTECITCGVGRGRRLRRTSSAHPMRRKGRASGNEKYAACHELQAAFAAVVPPHRLAGCRSRVQRQLECCSSFLKVA